MGNNRCADAGALDGTPDDNESALSTVAASEVRLMTRAFDRAIWYRSVTSLVTGR